MPETYGHTRRRLALALTLLSLAGFAFTQSGGGFNLSWNTPDSGYHDSVADSFQHHWSLRSAIGQPDATSGMSGSRFSLQGGYLVGGEVPRNAAAHWREYALPSQR